MGHTGQDVAEIFSPPRFTEKAANFGLKPGFAVDLTTTKENGEAWDLRNKADQCELADLQDREDPYFLCGGPPCEAFTQLRHLL